MNGYNLIRKQLTQDTAIEARVKKTGDTITGNLNIAANILPTTNNTRDLGSSTLAFRKVYGSATSADKLTTARSFTINNSTKSFNGEGNVSWTLNEIGAAASSHNHNSSNITAMTSYAKGTSSAAIATSDTLNQAIGKLEVKVDSKAASNHTHLYAGSSSAGGAATTSLACTGNSATATKLQTARTINGVSFDGSQNITVADNTKLPLTGGTLTGDLTISKSNAGLTIRGKDSNYYKITHSSANGTLVFNYNSTGLFTIQNNGDIIPIGNRLMSIGSGVHRFTTIYADSLNTSAAQIETTTMPNTVQVKGNQDSGMGAIKLGTGGCRIYGRSDTERMFIEGGIYTNRMFECGDLIIANGPVYPGRDAQGGWDCGLSNRRFYTVYCVNVNQSSDRNMKEDIHYLDEKSNSNVKMISSTEDTPFRDFLKDELRLASYKYKRQITVENEDGTESIETIPHKEEDSQLGFIAQDIRNTEIGSMFVYGEDGNMSYSPTGFTAVIAKALQEEIKHRDNQIKALEERIRLLENK